jgi:hypothetical protein
MDPEKMIARIQKAPADVKNYISKNFSSIDDFVSSYLPSIDKDQESDQSIEVIINGVKRKFKNKKEAEKAIQLAKEKGQTIDA